MKKIILLFVLFCQPALSKGYDVFGLGLYDIKFDGSQKNEALDFRYERRFDHSLFEIGPESYDFFNLKPFVGFEATSELASYFLAGVYLEDNIGTLFTGDSSNFILEICYQLENENRIGLSFGHISNANLGNKNPGVEILSLSYQIAY